MKFSIIIPAYNVERYLKKCVDSVLMQEFNDYEIIIVDDGSTDNTGVLIDEIYNNNKSKIRIIHQINKGLGGARNSGVHISNGEYLFFLDSDDYIEKDTLSILDFYLEKYDMDIISFGFNSVKDGKCSEPGNTKREIELKRLTPKEFLIWCGPSAWNKVYKRTIFINNNIEYPEKLLYEDLATTPMLALSSLKIGKIDVPLYNYVHRKGSIITNTKFKRIFELFSGYDRVIEYYRSNNAFDEYYYELEFLAIIHALFFTDLRIMECCKSKKYYEICSKYVEERFPRYKENIYISDKELLKANGVDLISLGNLLNKKYWLVKNKYYPFQRIKRIIKKIRF